MVLDSRKQNWSRWLLGVPRDVSGNNGGNADCSTTDSQHVSPVALVVSHEASRTGAPVVAWHLLRALRNAGYRTVVVHRWGGPLESNLTGSADVGRTEPLRTARVVLQRYARTKQLADRLERWAARRTIRSVRPDIVWCNTVLTWRYAEEAVRLGLPTILYGHEQSEWTGARLTAALHSAEQGLTLVGCSQVAAEVLASAAGRSLEAVAVLHSPVDAEDVIARGSVSASNPRSLTVVACGTANDGKGFDVFAAAAERSISEMPQLRWRWVGRPPEDQSDLPSNLELVGEVPDAVPYLAAADIVAVPSRADSFPLVVLESMALAQPIVASDLAGIREQLDDTGVLVPSGDPDLLWGAVRDLLNHPQRAHGLGRAAQQRCRKLWDIERFDQQVAELSEAVRANRPVRPPLRVVHLMGRLSPGGGVQVVVRRLAEHVDPNEVELHVVTMRPPWDDLSDVPVEFHPLGFGGPRLRPWNRLYIMVRAALTTRSLRADVVHVHSGMAWLGLLARVVLPRTPFVLEVHDAPGSGRHGDLTDRFEGFCVRRFGMTAVCHSLQVETALIELSRIPRERICRFPLGIDTDVFAPISVDERTAVRYEFGLPVDGVMAVAIGRAARSKRFDLAIDAVAAARDCGADISLVLVGVGQPMELVDQRQRLGLVSQVHLLDGHYGSDLARLLAACDLLMSTSEYEGFGLTLIEAMACGLPVIAMAVGGVTDIVINGETGFLVQLGAVDEMVEHLVALADNQDMRHRLGKAGRIRAVESFDTLGTALEFTSLYQRLNQRQG